MSTLIDFLADNFPLKNTDKARLSAFDTDGSHIYAASVVKWYWAFKEEAEEYTSVRVTTQLHHDELTIYDDRSDDYNELLDRIDYLEGRYLDNMDANGLPDQALYLEICYIQDREEGIRAIVEDVFLIMPVEQVTET